MVRVESIQNLVLGVGNHTESYLTLQPSFVVVNVRFAKGQSIVFEAHIEVEIRRLTVVVFKLSQKRLQNALFWFLFLFLEVVEHVCSLVERLVYLEHPKLLHIVPLTAHLSFILFLAISRLFWEALKSLVLILALFVVSVFDGFILQ